MMPPFRPAHTRELHPPSNGERNAPPSEWHRQLNFALGMRTLDVLQPLTARLEPIFAPLGMLANRPG